MGSAGSHWLLGADRRTPSADRGAEAGVLGGENRPGALAFWLDGDRHDRHGRNHGGPSRRPRAGVRPVDSAHVSLRKVVCGGASAEHTGGPPQGSGEKERGAVTGQGGGTNMDKRLKKILIDCSCVCFKPLWGIKSSLGFVTKRAHFACFQKMTKIQWTNLHQ